MKHLRLALVVALCLTVVAAAAGVQSPGRSSVRGAVSKSGRPVSSAWVIVSQSGQEKGRALTGDDGKYYIGYLNDATYDIVVLKDKSQLFKGQISLPKNATFNIKV
jgi:hypothetical protein